MKRGVRVHLSTLDQIHHRGRALLHAKDQVILRCTWLSAC